jgi:hypothetical protein
VNGETARRALAVHGPNRRRNLDRLFVQPLILTMKYAGHDRPIDRSQSPWPWTRLLTIVVAILASHPFSRALGAQGDLGQRAVAVETPSGYLPGLPTLVRIELRDSHGARDRGAWDAEAELSVTQSNVTLSTNRVTLRNGLGSSLVTFGGGGDLELVVSCNGLTARRTIMSMQNQPMTRIGGTLPGASTTWTGLVLVTNDVIVPTNHVLTLQPGTWLLLAGVASGTNGADLQVNGEIESLGTLDDPVVITCATANLRWGQIRHAGAQPSFYGHTIVTLGGRARGEGHTGQAPVIRATNSRIGFNHCSITDHATAAGTPGKIMQATGSSIAMTNCLLARARMGPEIEGTSLQFVDSYIIDMRGPDDADGIYLHSQAAGQQIRLAGCVIAGGDDDGIDTLGSVITVDDCIVRGWKYPGDDSKGISVFGGECRLWRSLLADNTIGLSGKGGNGENVRVRIDHCTIVGNSYGVAVTNKSGTTPVIDYRITNSIILAPDPVFTQYEAGDIHIDYSLVGEAWPGTGVLEGDPGFVDAASSNFLLKPFSQCIDAGDPLSPLDPDGSPTDIGWAVFIPPAPRLVQPTPMVNPFNFFLQAYTNRNYVIETSSNLTSWSVWKTQFQPTDQTPVTDPAASPGISRFYRAKLAP